MRISKLVVNSSVHDYRFAIRILLGRYQSGQLGRTVNPLSYDFKGSNPFLPTINHLYLSNNNTNDKCCRLIICGSSSDGRATAFQAVGRGFEPRLPLELKS